MFYPEKWPFNNFYLSETIFTKATFLTALVII
jgi:hypothetical protein